MNGTQQSRKLRIAIIGAGMAGLTLAAALRNVDPNSIELNLYEAASEVTEIGAGISLWRRTWAALKHMGLEEPLCETLQYKPTDDPTMPELFFEYRKGDVPNGGLVTRIYRKGGLMSFHRRALQRTLYENRPEFCKAHLNHRLISYTEAPDYVTLQFQNGETAVCDLLIGADGIKSVVRNISATHFGSGQPMWLGRFAYRALIPAEKLRAVDPNHIALDTPINYMGKNAHVVSYPILGKTIVNLAVFDSDPAKEGAVLNEPVFRQATKEEMMDKYTGWNQEVKTLLNCAENPLRWAIQAIRPLKTYVTDRIALLGDAAHAMPPHLGGGAGQAIEDAWILGTLISNLHCTSQTVPIVLRRYNEIRKPYGNKILTDSIKQGHFYELNTPEFNNAESPSDDDYEQLGNMISVGLEWGEDPEPLLEDGRRALYLADEPEDV